MAFPLSPSVSLLNWTLIQPQVIPQISSCPSADCFSSREAKARGWGVVVETGRGACCGPCPRTPSHPAAAAGLPGGRGPPPGRPGPVLAQDPAQRSQGRGGAGCPGLEGKPETRSRPGLRAEQPQRQRTPAQPVAAHGAASVGTPRGSSSQGRAPRRRRRRRARPGQACPGAPARPPVDPAPSAAPFPAPRLPQRPAGAVRDRLASGGDCSRRTHFRVPPPPSDNGPPAPALVNFLQLPGPLVLPAPPRDRSPRGRKAAGTPAAPGRACASSAAGRPQPLTCWRFPKLVA